MPSKELHVISFILGHTTLWFRVTVPRASVFGNAKPEFLTMLFDEITGDEVTQANKIADLARATQGLTYMEGPALIFEDIDVSEGAWDREDIIALRIRAMLDYMMHEKRLDHATINDQLLEVAEAVDDKTLKRAGMFTRDEEFRDPARHCIAALRRARTDDDWLDLLWPEYTWNPGHGYSLARDDEADDGN